MDESMRKAGTKRSGQRWVVWSGVGGAILLIVAGGLVFLTAPDISGSDAAKEITAFYTDAGKRATQFPAEFLTLFGAFLFLWFIGGLQGVLQSWEGDDHRYASSAYAGGLVFTVLTVASLTADTTMVGALAFSDSLHFDANTAILLSHLGYVLQTGAMMGAAVMLFATGRAARGTKSRKKLEIASYALGALSLLSMVMVWIPMFLFLIWVVIVSLTVLRVTPDEGEGRPD